MRPLLVFVLAGYVLTGIAAAQSLGEVARREEARRKAVTSARQGVHGREPAARRTHGGSAN